MLMDYFCLIAINGLSLILLILLVGFWRKLRKQFLSPAIFDLVAFFMSVKVVLIYLLPAILRVYSDWSKDREIGALPSEIVTAYAVEFISLLVWWFFVLLTLYLIRYGRLFMNTKHGRRRVRHYTREPIAPLSGGMTFPNSVNLFTEQTAKLFMTAICVLYLVFFPYTIEAALMASEGQGNLIQPVVMLAGPVVGLYLFSRGTKEAGTAAFVLGTVITAMGFVAGFAFGSRGQVISAALWLIFLYFFVTRKKFILYISLVVVVGVLLFHNAMTVFRADTEFMNKSFYEKVENLVKGLDTEKDEGEGLLSSLEFRFGEASRKSVGFLRLVDQGSMAGLQPILSSLYAPIPRRYFPDKPEPGSLDGTKEGMGMYIIHRVMDGSSNMSEFFTGVHAYWELGMLGVFLLSSLSGIFIALCVGYFGKLGAAGLPMMMILLKPPWLEPKLWISETVLHVIHTIIPLVFLWYLGYFFVLSCCKARELMVQIVPAKANI